MAELELYRGRKRFEPPDQRRRDELVRELGSLGWTGTRLAEFLGLHQSTISKILHLRK